MTFVAFLLQVVLPLLGALGGLGGGIAWYKAHAERDRILAERQQFEADAAGMITQTALSLIAPLKARIQEMDRERVLLQNRVQVLEQELSDTRTDLAQANARIYRLRRDLASAQDRITELERERNELRRENEQYRQLIDVLRQTHQEGDDEPGGNCKAA